jgi:Zn finger protein HypA/HybF involved in hydrogenase expression
MDDARQRESLSGQPAAAIREIDVLWISAGLSCDRVTRVVVEIGGRAAVVPDALRFCFELACADTPLAGATLEIIDLGGDELRVECIEVA